MPQPFNIYQIYYNEPTHHKCYSHPGVLTWQNTDKPAPLFENKIFLHVPIKTDCLYTGVWSWKADQKIKLAGNTHFDLGTLRFKAKTAYQMGIDLIAFHHTLKRQIIFHGEEREEFNKHFQMILDKFAGVSLAKYQPKVIIMSNHFLLKPGLFLQYRGFLKEVVHFISFTPGIKEFALKRSSYLPDSPVNYCYMPFLLELIPSLWATITPNIKIAYYKDIPMNLESEFAYTINWN
jgi:hypothetical protein